MTVLHFTTTKFFEYLELYGAKKCDDFPEDYITVYEHEGNKVPIQIRQDYCPCYVIKICDALKIRHPKDFDKVAAQLKEAASMSKRK
ncbi:MAG: hypothetical protein ABI855_06990 [Bacteroidota bacterium]